MITIIDVFSKVLITKGIVLNRRLIFTILEIETEIVQTWERCRNLKLINIHTHKSVSGSEFILNATIDDLPGVPGYYSCGIHPWDIEKIEIDLQIDKLRKHCIKNKLLAIGEIGLDKAISTDLQIQEKIFIQQLELAKEFKLPVIIHCIRAWNEILSIRRSSKYKNIWIFHGFNGNLQIAEQIIKSGCYLSLGKALLSNLKLQEVLVQLPIEYVFFETDNSDEKIMTIYQKAAGLLHICIEELSEKIYSNFTKVFGER